MLNHLEFRALCTGFQRRREDSLWRSSLNGKSRRREWVLAEVNPSSHTTVLFFSCPLNHAQHTSTKLLHNERCGSKFSMSCVHPRKSAVKRDCSCLVAKSCPTLCNPMDCSPPGSSVHVISQARMLE